MLGLTDLRTSVSLPVLLVGSPLLYHRLIRRERNSSRGLVIASTGLFGLVPLLVQTRNKVIDGCVKGLSFFLLLRAWEAACIDRTVSSKWSLKDFVEFLVTSSNAAIRKREKKRRKRGKKNGWEPETVGPGERDFKWYAKTVVSVGLHYGIYAGAKTWIGKYGVMRVDALFLPNPIEHWRAWVDHAVYGGIFYCTLYLAYTLGTLPLCVLLHAPFTEIFDHPVLSTTLREFWSRRWNYPVKCIFHRIAYEPIYSKLKPPGDGRGIQSVLAITAATMSSFLFSALFHEYTLLLLLPELDYSLRGRNFMFFAGHGLLVILEGVWLRLIRRQGVSNGPKHSPFGMVIGWCWSMGTLWFLSPLFLGPYIESRVLEAGWVSECLINGLCKLFDFGAELGWHFMESCSKCFHGCCDLCANIILR
ncbi:hypothetical protein HDU79_008607 [Rhizoclosmatium sp. JEL0117]|nr:hypothetical protein HDU79_008607 [Rhizoclosmatium sp. JEL0117]